MRGAGEWADALELDPRSWSVRHKSLGEMWGDNAELDW